MVFLPLALAFVIASRHGGACAKYRGTLVLIEGCAVQMAGLAALVLAIEWIDTPSVPGRKRRECEPGPILLCMGLFSRFCVRRPGHEILSASR